MNRRDFLAASALLVPYAARAFGQPTLDTSLQEQIPTAGPLAIHPRNGRYFGDRNGQTVLLLGSHLGWELQDDAWNRKITFDYTAYLDLLTKYGQNVVRLWCVEHTRSSGDAADTCATPMPFVRVGAELALDGRPKFDLTRFDPAYFDRLRRRTIEARDRGLYVMVMLFQGWSLRGDEKSDPWFGHYFNPANHLQGIPATPQSAHTLSDARLTRIQEAYVGEVTQAVGDLDNVLYEISNESLGSLAWHEHFVSFVRECPSESRMPHPIVLSGCRRGLVNGQLLQSQAEAIGVSRDTQDAYLADPPAADGSKVIVVDSDHVKPDTNDPGFVWRNLFRGNHVLVLDWGLVPDSRHAKKNWHPIRNATHRAGQLASRVDLARFSPRGELSSTGYCLATAGGELLVYLPEGGDVRLNGVEPGQKLNKSWYDTARGTWLAEGAEAGRKALEVTSPLAGPAVLHFCPV